MTDFNELPRYRSHKQVQAFQILTVVPKPLPEFKRPTCKGCFALKTACGNCERCEWERRGGQNAYLIANDSFTIEVGVDYVQKHDPKPGGYYVRYEDGYESFSPAAAFEGGHTPLADQGDARNAGVSSSRAGAPVDLNRASELTPLIEAAVDDAFCYHPWNGEMIKRGTQVREALANAVKVIIDCVPPGPDRTVAIRKIREARMDANSAITHNGRY